MTAWFLTFWTLSTLLALSSAALFYLALFHDRSRGRRRCPRCWYDMAGTPGLTCPECGRTAKRDRAFLRTRRRPRRALAALLLALLAYTAFLIPRAIAAGSLISVIPTPVLAVVLQFSDVEGEKIFKNLQARISGAASGTTKPSKWEQLLVARHCAKILRAPDAATTGAPITPPMTSGIPVGQSVRYFTYSLPAPPTKHQEALDVLVTLGPQARPALPELIAILDDPNSPDRSYAVTVVVGLGASAADAFPSLSRALDDPGLAQTALASLRRLGKGAMNAEPSLIAFLGSAAPQEDLIAGGRIFASLIPAPRTIPALRKLLKSARVQNRIAAARTLEYIGIPARLAIPDIARAAADPPAPIKSTGMAILAGFGEAAVPTLASIIDSPDDELASSAAFWLATLYERAAPAHDALLRALSRTHPAVRGCAAAALGKINAKDALPALRALSSDPDPGVRLRATEAVQALTAP